MFILLTTAIMLTAAFTLHVILWRLRRPRRELRALLLLGPAVFGFLFVMAALGYWPFSVGSFAALGLICLTTGAVWLAYCEFYLAVQEESPSSRMLLFAARHTNGVCQHDLLRIVADAPNGPGRVESLLASGLVQPKESGLSLTPRGERLLTIIESTTRLYKLSPPGEAAKK